MALREIDLEEAKGALNQSFQILAQIDYPDLDRLKELVKETLT